jgi:hypothetical protein
MAIKLCSKTDGGKTKVKSDCVLTRFFSTHSIPCDFMNGSQDLSRQNKRTETDCLWGKSEGRRGKLSKTLQKTQCKKKILKTSREESHITSEQRKTADVSLAILIQEKMEKTQSKTRSKNNCHIRFTNYVKISQQTWSTKIPNQVLLSGKKWYLLLPKEL